jgi:hypothetical protein
MTCGIYILKFNGTDKVYVGQSENIEYRYKKHIQRLKAGTHNYKMQKAYIQYGIPELEIILAGINKEDLNIFELEAFSIYNAIENGFNIAEYPSIHGNGDKNPAAKYSNDKIIEVFKLLLDPANSYKHIESITEVSISTIRHIANKEAHTWLKTEFPEEYAILENLSGGVRKFSINTAENKGIVYPPIVSPEGKEYTVTNVAAFAREHKLDSSSLAKVLKRRPQYVSHKGWRLKPLTN